MCLKLTRIFVVFLVFNISFAQKNEKVLLRIDEDKIMTSEFLRVYNKNLDLVQDEDQKTVDGYLKLFVEYQLKLKEAKRLKLYEDTKYQSEFLKYKKQLIKKYLAENEVTSALVKEAYERSTQDVQVSHILVRVDDATVDTTAIYNQVLELRARVLSEGFDAVKESVHNGKTVFMEDLGYFSAFKMVYEFENAAYQTPVGKLSMPFKTQFGYHVVYVRDKRPALGTVKVAHIMILHTPTDSLLDTETRINSIYSKLKQGESFEALAKQFSDDKNSSGQGGELQPFTGGQINSLIFEEKAFAITENGAVSEPFKTRYGWHILKRLDWKPTPSFEDVKLDLEIKIKGDSRSKLINAAIVAKLKKNYNIVYNPEAQSYFENIISNEFFQNSWQLPDNFIKDDMLFSINDTITTFEAFGKHLIAVKPKYSNKTISLATVIKREFDTFFESTILKHREENLEHENKEFADILKEYKDGLLLFELLEKNVWNKASKDTTGLKSFYEANKNKYQWTDRADVFMATSANESDISEVIQLLNAGLPQDSIMNLMNSDSKKNIMFTKGTFSTSDAVLPSDIDLKKGISKIYNYNQAFHVLDIKDIFAAGTKTFTEAKGSVVNDYQQELETNWLKELQARYSVQIDKKALHSLKKQIKNQ